LIKPYSSGGIGTNCYNLHVWWDDTGTSEVQAIVVLCIHGAEELRRKGKLG